MKVRLCVKTAVTLLLIATLIMTFIISPVLANSDFVDGSEDHLSTQNTGKDVPSGPTNLGTATFGTTDLKYPNSETLTGGNVKPNSTVGDESNLNSTNEWSEFIGHNRRSAQLVIGINNGISDAYTRLMDIIAKHDCEVVNTVSMAGETIAIVVNVSSTEMSSFVKETRADGLSRYIGPRMKVQAQLVPNDPYWSLQWGPQKIEADWAWNTTIGDPSVLVTVIDTGIDWDHPDLAANYVALGYDWVNNDADPMDDEGHGTHCAGIIAAVINNSIGVAGLAQVRIMAEKGLDQYGEGYEDDLANAIIHAVDQGADILSNSWGSYGKSPLIHDAVKHAYDSGVLVVAAAGNEATSNKLYPAAFDEVIAVSATDEYDNPASWTNFGDWIELAAPGVSIYSTYWDDSYTYKSGTSMSTPHVSGTAALIWSQFPNMTRDWVRAQLRYTADDLGDPGFDDYYGYGRINARKAVEQAPLDHDLLIFGWESPPYVKLGELATFNTTVLNFGIINETNVEVQLLVNSSLVDSASIAFLPGGASTTVGLLWTPTEEGTYNVTSYVVPVPDETITQNNIITEIVTVVAPPPDTNWILLATDPDEGVGTSLKAIYGQLYSDIIYFKVEHHWPWTTINDINTGIFIDADQDPSTGLPDGFYPSQNTGIGADYVIVVGFEATEMWKWDPIAEWWDLDNRISLAYLDAPDGSNVFVVGVYLASVETAGILDCAVTDTMSDWDWMPDAGHFTWFLIRYEHELIVFLETPQRLQPGETSLLNATVYNIGLNNETNVELQLLINGTIFNNETIPELVNGTSYTINYSWTPTVEAVYNITAYAPPVPGENVTANNWYTKFVKVGYAVMIGIIETHGETLHSEELANYYTSLGHIVEKITTTITPGVLDNYDIIIVGEDWGETPWLPSEIAAVEAFIDSGKGFVTIGDELAPSVQEILDTYGISYTGISAPGGSSSHFDPLHPIMQGVSLIYASNPVNSLQIAAPAYWIANDVSDTYILIAGAEVGGYVLCLSNDFAASLYDDDNEVMFKNIVDWMTVKYEHELAVRLDAPNFLEPGDSSLLNATVYNGGLNNETGVELFLLINGTIVDNVTIPELLSGSSYTLSHLWTPTVEALYNITAYAPSVAGENITTNNFATKIVIVRFAKYVLWDDVHDDDGDSLTGNYLLLYQLLSSSGFVVDELTSGTINSGVLAPYDILVLIDPEYDFLSSEITDIHDWVEAGGALIVIPDAGYPPTLNTIMASYGAQLTGLDTGWGTTTNIIAHPITQDVGSIYYDRAWELAVSLPSEALAWTLEYYAFLSATTGGEVVVISDSNIMDNYGIGMADNTQLMLNMFNWIGVKYEHDLAVTLDAPTFLEPSDSSLLNATVYNNGLSNETDVELHLLINGTEVESVVIPELLTGSSYTLSYTWTPTIEGIYNVTAYAPPVLDEDVTANNVKSVIVLVQVLPDILIVNDDDGSSLISGTSLLEFELALTATGYDYWVWNESSMGNPPLDFLTKFQLVIWTCGDYWNWAVDPVDAVTLESYLAQGGNILLEGEDIGYDHHADDFMVNVAHAIYQVDDTGAPGLTVTDPTHPVTQGLPANFAWLTDPPYDDGVTPTNGGFEVIRYTDTSWTAVTVFDGTGTSNGSIVYYAFPIYCLAQSERDTLIINSVNWLLPPPRYTLTVYSVPSGVTFTVDGVSHTTPWSETYDEGTLVSLVMPSTHSVGDARYYWNQWSDGNTSRSRTVTMNTNVTLTAHYTGPYYQLTVTSSPITGITFSINGTPKTTPYTEWLLEGSYTLVMPETHNGYVWSHWLEDGDTNRIKTITLPETTWTAVYAPAPVGGKAAPINIPINKPELPALCIWLTILLPLAATTIFVKLKKKKQ